MLTQAEVGKTVVVISQHVQFVDKNEWARQRALKRGGGEPTTSLDTAVAEQRFAAELAAGEPPDRLYERQWAMTLLG